MLDFCLDILDGVRGLHFLGDGLASQCLDEDLHTASAAADINVLGLGGDEGHNGRVTRLDGL